MGHVGAMVGACLMFGYFPIWISTESKRSRECRGLGVVRAKKKRSGSLRNTPSLRSRDRRRDRLHGPRARPSARHLGLQFELTYSLCILYLDYRRVPQRAQTAIPNPG